MKGVIYMLDIEKLMREGKTLEDIGRLVTDEMNAAQTKIDAEKKAAEAAVKADETLRNSREAVVAALTSYISLLLGEAISEDIVRAGVMDMEESVDALKKIKVSVNGSGFKSIFDLI